MGPGAYPTRRKTDDQTGSQAGAGSGKQRKGEFHVQAQRYPKSGCFRRLFMEVDLVG